MRIIDGKHAVVAEKIVKHLDGVFIEEIPEGEPLFLFRARDKFAIEALRAYLKICADNECSGYQLGAVAEHIAKFSLWAKCNADKMKEPGSSQGR